MLKFFDYFKKYQKNKNNLLVIFGAGLIGRLTFEALKEKNIKVNYFCDSDKRKQTEFENIKIISPNDLDKLDKNTDIFHCTQYFDSVIPFLKNKGFKNFYKSSDLLSSIDNEKIYKGSLSSIKLNRYIEFYDKMSMKEDYIRDAKLNFKSIDIQITEKCSLKCKDCSNLMQYYEKPQDSALDILFKSIDRFMSCIDALDEFRVLGGDPFMNKELYKIINKLVTYEKCKKVIVYTNAKIVPKGENLNCLKNKKVILDITNYGECSSSHLKIVELAKKENLAFTTNRCTTWMDCGKIMPFTNKNEKELKHMFKNCCNSDLISLLHGKLYGCPFSANAVNLKAIPQNDSDEVNLINDALSIAELREQIKKLCYEKKYLTACSYCNGRDYSVANIPAAIQTKKPLQKEVTQN
jgi:hypothetical protein